VLWLLNFKKDKNFYTWNDPEHDDESLSYDLVCRGLEWLSGTHRIHKYDILLERFLKQGLKPEHYEHYLQAFKYGIPSEAGFSFGLERMTQKIFNLDNIREATLFPSDLKRIAGAKIHNESLRGEEIIVDKIKEILASRGLQFEFFEHEATVTSDDAARVRGTKPQEGVKALVLSDKKSGENIMVCLPGNAKIDMKKLSDITGAKYSFEEPDKINEKFGLRVGGVPPFGNILGLKTYYDKSVLNEEYASFNCGSKYKSIRMKSKDLVGLAQPELVDIRS
jgi:nondiscriminating aspartyl-tRNA synthetase